MIILTHPTGNANVRAAASGLNDAGLLKEFHTSIASYPGNFLDKLSGIGPLAEIGRRSFDPKLSGITRMWPWWELARLCASKFGFRKLTDHQTGIFSTFSVYLHHDRNTAAIVRSSVPKNLEAVYAYEDGAEYSFQAAKEKGITCFYDLPIGYWKTARKLMEKEKERWPEWSMTMGGLLDSARKLQRKDNELILADFIFVASSFTASTLKDFEGPLAEIKVIPYGFPKPVSARTYTYHTRKRKLKLLFVGGLSQRKGIADLFAAVEELSSDVELTVVGRKSVDHCEALNTALSKHQWIPSLPHAEVLKLMGEHDVLVFPSLFEGFGLVITEAMSQGTPVITTERTAGPDLIVDGQNGWLVEAGNVNQLRQAITNLVNNPEHVSKAGYLAIETARLRPWNVYGEELADAIKNNLKTKI
ncbi:glycosyltransferase family 4 protein [Pedobacter metabolipauper]|uniref:Glycosyl transferase family 1 n=1 Tax=Pedobacter metabolipauper TaxID=425513 RepID=A0A4R6SX14_9SPHI|nr:glycosyltransferase family 4 protein [Pedobacter metabolipauper]TDQ09991.1 glycosyl transferase family 1 [Pedobacter metabolipauper]